MYIIPEGDVFDYWYAGRKVTNIAHGCNAVGLMGAGMAKTIADKYPDNYKAYKKACNNGSFVNDMVLPWTDGETTIYNLYTQFQPGNNAKVHLIHMAVCAMIEHANEGDIIVMPAIGCGIGGLYLHQVVSVITQAEKQYNKGVELHMIANYKAGRTEG